jgi:hypothetical protein
MAWVLAVLWQEIKTYKSEMNSGSYLIQCNFINSFKRFSRDAEHALVHKLVGLPSFAT